LERLAARADSIRVMRLKLSDPPDFAFLDWAARHALTDGTPPEVERQERSAVCLTCRVLLL